MGRAIAEKGKRFEDEFAAWMESDLGYTALHTRVPIKGQISERAYEVDVHGVKTNKPMAALRFGAIALVVVAFCGAFTGDPDLNQAAVSAAKAIDPRLADYALLAFASLLPRRPPTQRRGLIIMPG